MGNQELEQRLQSLEVQLRRNSAAVGGMLLIACILLGLWNLHVAMLIPKFQEIYLQMLDGKELPQNSQFVLDSSAVLFALAVALPLGASLTFFTIGRTLVGHSTLLAILLVTGLQIYLTRTALWEPMVNIISDMTLG